MNVFLCSVFLIMSEVTVTTTTTTSPVTVVCSGALFITMTVVMAPTSVGQTSLGQYDVVLMPLLILRDIVGVLLASPLCPSNKKPQYQMPSQAYASYAMGPLQVSFLF